MAVHVVLLGVAAGGFLKAFHFSLLVWPFNLVLPLVRDLPRACVALRAAAELFAGELRAYLSGQRRVPRPVLGYRHPSSTPAAAAGALRSPDELVSYTMIALVGISY